MKGKHEKGVGGAGEDVWKEGMGGGVREGGRVRVSREGIQTM